MSKIIKKRNSKPQNVEKKNISQNTLIKKQIVNNGIYEEFWISNVYIFLKNIP